MKTVRQKCNGFTLIEVMIATAILVSAVSMAVFVLMDAQQTTLATRQRLLALNAARSTLEAIKTTALVSVPTMTTTQYVSADLPSGAVAVMTNPSTITAATTWATITVNVTWRGPRNRPMSLPITTIKSRY